MLVISLTRPPSCFLPGKKPVNTGFSVFQVKLSFKNLLSQTRLRKQEVLSALMCTVFSNNLLQFQTVLEKDFQKDTHWISLMFVCWFDPLLVIITEIALILLDPSIFSFTIWWMNELRRRCVWLRSQKRLFFFLDIDRISSSSAVEED